VELSEPKYNGRHLATTGIVILLGLIEKKQHFIVCVHGDGTNTAKVIENVKLFPSHRLNINVVLFFKRG